MKILTEERSWRNFWIAVVWCVVCCVFIAFNNPPYLWVMILASGASVGWMLFDSWRARDE